TSRGERSGHRGSLSRRVIGDGRELFEVLASLGRGQAIALKGPDGKPNSDPETGAAVTQDDVDTVDRSGRLRLTMSGTEWGQGDPMLRPLAVFVTAFLVLVTAPTLHADPIHACVQSSNGKIRIVAVAGMCRRTETALEWSSSTPSTGPFRFAG